MKDTLAPDDFYTPQWVRDIVRQARRRADMVLCNDWCVERIWANGDMEYCGGERVVGTDRCATHSKARNCPNCGGRGEVRIGRGYFRVTQGCEDCAGTGRVTEAEKK